MIASARRLARRARATLAWRRANGAFGRRLFAIASLLVLLSSALGGRSYLWCSMMERAVEACCCDPPREDGDDAPRGAAIHAGCCQDHAIAELDKARTSLDAPEVPAALPASAPVALAIPSVATARAFDAPRLAPAPRWSSIRAGPRSASDTCARLQVYHC